MRFRRAVTLEDADAVIQAGKAFSTPATVKVISTEDFAEGRVYVVPVTMVEVDGLGNIKTFENDFLCRYLVLFISPH